MFQYLVSIGTLAAITALLTLGLNSRWGLGGELDLGYYLFVALGAYVDGVLTLPAASTQPGVHYILGLNLPYNGLYGASQPFEGVLHLGPQPYQTFYFGLCVVILAAVFVILELIRRSPFGRAVKSVREDEVAAAAYGRNPYRLRLKAYVIGGVVAGLGGSLFMHYISAFNPASWSPLETFLLYGALLVGGTANSFGAVAGAVIVLVAFPQLTQLIPAFGSNSNAGPAVQAIAIGLLIIVVLRFRPAGLLPELKTMSGQLRTAGSWNWRARRGAGPGES